MGFRVKKSFNFGPFRLNLSKTGAGFSFGLPGWRFTKMANGRNRNTFSIPGTGISYVSESKMKKNSVNDNHVVHSDPAPSKIWRSVWIVLLIVVIIATMH